MPGRRYEQLLELAHEQHGFLTPDDARRLRMDPAHLRTMHGRGTLDKLARGVYRMPTVPPGPLDEYMQAVLWPQGALGVLSHETALDLYDISDVNPGRIHITVPRGHRPQRDIPSLYEIHHEDLPENDVTRLQGLPIVTIARAIAGCIGAGVRAGLLEQAIDTARRRGRLSASAADALHAHLRRRGAA